MILLCCMKTTPFGVLIWYHGPVELFMMPIMGPSTSVKPPPVQAHLCIRAMTFCPVENIISPNSLTFIVFMVMMSAC